MNEQVFLQAVSQKSKELNVNPLLLLSGIEGLYSFKDVQMNSINYGFLDSLILTIFALRIGDSFHTVAEENLQSKNKHIRESATHELTEMTKEDIASSQNPYLQSFAQLVNGKSPIRKYHEKALEVAALEIRKAQLIFNTDSIGLIMLGICKEDSSDSLGLRSLFHA